MYASTALTRLRQIPELVANLMADRAVRRDALASNPRNAPNLAALRAGLDTSISAQLASIRATVDTTVGGERQRIERLDPAMAELEDAEAQEAEAIALAALNEAESALSDAHTALGQ